MHHVYSFGVLFVSYFTSAQSKQASGLDLHHMICQCAGRQGGRIVYCTENVATVRFSYVIMFADEYVCVAHELTGSFPSSRVKNSSFCSHLRPSQTPLASVARRLACLFSIPGRYQSPVSARGLCKSSGRLSISKEFVKKKPKPNLCIFSLITENTDNHLVCVCVCVR